MDAPVAHERDRFDVAARWIGLAIGVPVLLIGLRGAWVHRIDTRPYLGSRELVRFWLGGALLHDLLVVPVVIAIGLAVRAVVPAAVRRFVQAGILVSVGLVVVSYPSVRGFGRISDNPSLLPRNYSMGLIVALAWTWVVVAGLAIVANVRGRRTQPG